MATRRLSWRIRIQIIFGAYLAVLTVIGFAANAWLSNPLHSDRVPLKEIAVQATSDFFTWLLAIKLSVEALVSGGLATAYEMLNAEDKSDRLRIARLATMTALIFFAIAGTQYMWHIAEAFRGERVRVNTELNLANGYRRGAEHDRDIAQAGTELLTQWMSAVQELAAYKDHNLGSVHVALPFALRDRLNTMPRPCVVRMLIADDKPELRQFLVMVIARKEFANCHLDWSVTSDRKLAPGVTVYSTKVGTQVSAMFHDMFRVDPRTTDAKQEMQTNLIWFEIGPGSLWGH